jgi:antitoxin (DNA-binding transcriptional repressor) of toxin-antitoxin stability system
VRTSLETKTAFALQATAKFKTVMDASIGAFGAKAQLSRLLRAVEQSESFTITVRGKPVAIWSPTMPTRPWESPLPSPLCRPLCRPLRGFVPSAMTTSPASWARGACGRVSKVHRDRRLHGPGLVVRAAAAQRSTDHAITRTLNKPIQRTMQAISANELKIRGIGAISEALEHEQEVGLSVRGQLRYVVMDLAEFHRLRECELDLALQSSRADLAEGRWLEESVDAHLSRLDSLAAEPDCAPE